MVSESRPETRPRIRLDGVAKSFDGRTVVDVDSLTLGDHPIEGLIGPNGAGKTTLMRLVMHSTSLDRGTVTLEPEGPGSSEVVLSNLPPSRLAAHGVVKSNQVIMDFEQLTIMDSLLLSLATKGDERPYHVFTRETALYERERENIGWYLERFGFADPLGYARSAGEKKLLDIIRCLLLEPRVLLLDEPTAGIPDDVRDDVMQVLADKASSGEMAVVVVEHDLELIWNLCEYVHFMAEGSVLLQGDPQWIREHDTVIEKYLGGEHAGS